MIWPSHRDNPLIRKLEVFGPLAEDDKKRLAEVARNTRTIKAHTDIIREDEAPEDVNLIMSGFACRYKHLPDGTKQIMAYLVPGDFCDLHIFILKSMDHTIASISDCQLAYIPRKTVLELLERPSIARAFWWATLVDEATLREWLVNMGQREAEARIAHLFCELHIRLNAVGLAENGRFQLPLTQQELADTMGISSVHANRSLQILRKRKYISYKKQELLIEDIEGLRNFCSFNSNYLHQELGK